jgi:hypothetical protein
VNTFLAYTEKTRTLTEIIYKSLLKYIYFAAAFVTFVSLPIKGQKIGRTK